MNGLVNHSILLMTFFYKQCSINIEYKSLINKVDYGKILYSSKCV